MHIYVSLNILFSSCNIDIIDCIVFALGLENNLRRFFSNLIAMYKYKLVYEWVTTGLFSPVAVDGIKE
jgi:hypothetical protein